MKKLLALICCLFVLLLVSSCAGENDEADLCESLGGHELQYQSEGDVHWQACAREECSYRTESTAHSGGAATCRHKARCEACGALYGKYLPHDLKYVSNDASTHTYRCAFEGCDYSSESSESHSGGQATCKELAKCEKCNASYGGVSGHSYDLKAEGCDVYAVCSGCQLTELRGKHLLDADGVTCSGCKQEYFHVALEYTLSEDGKSYVVSGGEFCVAPTVVIPATHEGLPVTEIGAYAFYCSLSEAVVLPDTVKVIGEGAFCDSSITSFVIHDGVEVIGKAAFTGSKLESVVIGSGVKMIPEDAFSCTRLKSVTIPLNVGIIEKNAFLDCQQLEEVVLLDGVKRIESQAFGMCKSLKRVVLSDALEYVSGDWLRDASLPEFNVYEGMNYLGTATNPYFALIGSNGGTRLVTHPDTELLVSEALFNCEDVVSVELGPNVRAICPLALGGMDALESITVDPRNAYYRVINNILVDKVTGELLQGCKTSVIPNDGSITELDLAIFSYIGTIETIYIPKGIKTLYIDFDDLSGLETMIIESDVEKIIVSGNSDSCRTNRTSCFTVYHCHTEAQWASVVIEYTFSKEGIAFVFSDCYGDHATHRFYSEEPPTEEGNYWHFVDGVPTPW